MIKGAKDQECLACTGCDLFRGIAGGDNVFCGVCLTTNEGKRSVTERPQVLIGQGCDDYVASILVVQLKPVKKHQHRIAA